MLEHPRFRAAYDFLLLRCESGEMDKAVCDWWTLFQRADEAERQQMLITGGGHQKRRRRRRRKKTKRPEGGATGGAEAS